MAQENRDPVRDEAQASPSPQTPDGQLRPPLRRLAFLCLVLGFLPLFVVAAATSSDVIYLYAPYTVGAGIFLFGLFFSYGEWKLGRARKAGIILAVVTLTVLSFLVRWFSAF